MVVLRSSPHYTREYIQPGHGGRGAVVPDPSCEAWNYLSGAAVDWAISQNSAKSVAESLALLRSCMGSFVVLNLRPDSDAVVKFISEAFLIGTKFPSRLGMYPIAPQRNRQERRGLILASFSRHLLGDY